MRIAALASLLLVSSAAAQVQIQPQAVPAPNAGTLTVRVEPPPQKATSSFAEYVGIISELIRSAAWPLLLGILIVTQRRPLARLLDALIELIQRSDHIKLGDMVDVEINRSAKEAERREVPATEVTSSEIEAAARVGRMAESSDLSTIRTKIVDCAREYEATRSNMKPGSDRTRAMNAIVAKMRTLGIAAVPLLPELANDKTSPGKRLAALAILQLAPDLAYLNWIVERMGHEQPFLLFHASLALLATVRNYSAQSPKELEAAINRSLEVVESFAGGPDGNTINVLELARSELHWTAGGGTASTAAR